MSTYGKKLAEVSAWVDGYKPNWERDYEALLWGRVAKVSEEAGEAIGALIGATDQNPRKGITHDFDDVARELLDVACAALGGVEHIYGNDGQSLARLKEHINFVHARAMGADA